MKGVIHIITTNDNKLLLITAIRGYFMGLEQDKLVQPGYTVDIDVDAREQANSETRRRKNRPDEVRRHFSRSVEQLAVAEGARRAMKKPPPRGRRSLTKAARCGRMNRKSAVT